VEILKCSGQVIDTFEDLSQGGIVEDICVSESRNSAMITFREASHAKYVLKVRSVRISNFRFYIYPVEPKVSIQEPRSSILLNSSRSSKRDNDSYKTDEEKSPARRSINFVKEKRVSFKNLEEVERETAGAIKSPLVLYKASSNESSPKTPRNSEETKFNFKNWFGKKMETSPLSLIYHPKTTDVNNNEILRTNSDEKGTLFFLTNPSLQFIYRPRVEKYLQRISKVKPDILILVDAASNTWLVRYNTEIGKLFFC
jgi:hypothetical protein